MEIVCDLNFGPPALDRPAALVSPANAGNWLDIKFAICGLGMLSTFRVAHELPQDVARFEAEIVIDDAAGERGSVVFCLLTDRANNDWQ